MNDLINRLIIAAGQWDKFKEQQFKVQFAALFEELKRTANVNHDGAEKILMDAISKESAA